MKEELQVKMVEIISSIQTAVSKTGEFAAEQLPDIAMRYILYGRVLTVVQSVSLIVIGITCLSFALGAYWNPWNNSPYSWDQHKTRSESNYSVMYFGTVIGIALTSMSIATFDYMVWVAPKVWLIKELTSLIK